MSAIVTIRTETKWRKRGAWEEEEFIKRRQVEYK